MTIATSGQAQTDLETSFPNRRCGCSRRDKINQDLADGVMFGQNDGISWAIRTCSGEPTGSTLDVPRISNRSEDGNTIDRFPPRHCFEGDNWEIANADSQQCLEPSRSLRSPPAYVTLPYSVGSANFSRTRPRGESPLRCVLRMAAGTDKLISTPPGASHRRTLNIADRWGAAHPRRFLPLSRDGEGRFRTPSVSQRIWASISARREPVCGSSRRSLPDTHVQRMARKWLA
ncbi:hypothetical protein ABIB90_008112 [Bradyrhizobium sp. JR4.1]